MPKKPKNCFLCGEHVTCPIVGSEDCLIVKEAEEHRKRYQQILKTAFEEIYIFDADTLKFLEASDGALKNLGYTLDEMRDLTPADITAGISPSVFMSILSPLKSGLEEIARFTTTKKRKDGSTYDAEVRLQHLDGEHPVFIAMVTDITERKQYEAELKALAFRDPGTDLYNRRYFLEHLEGTIHNANRLHMSVGLILIDMDDFSNVNNTYGHLVGDKIITVFCEKIKKVFGRKTDVIARYGGDEFMVMCIDNTEKHLVAKCNELVMLLNEPYHHEGHDIVQTASIGICVRKGKNKDITAKQLIKGADQAMYEVKKLGKNAARVCTDEIK